MRGDLITILIAHRLSTVLHADRIFVLEKGQIVESGRHEDLLDLKGLYYAMWRQQIGERETTSTIVHAAKNSGSERIGPRSDNSEGPLIPLSTT